MTDNTLIDQEFPLPYNAYAAFDATSLKALMQQRLTQNGTFTDQIFEGSNFNNLLDVIAYSYNVLLYYLNQTSNESLFSNSTIYENMNKVVKLLNYNPIGMQTSILNYTAVATADLQQGVYTIPRYSYFTINDVKYSFNKDITFVKSSEGEESLSELSDYSILHQGTFIEYPVYVATGEPFEEISLINVNNEGVSESIDHNNIHLYVRDSTGLWKQWNRVENIFLHPGNSEVFEVRFNENQRYVIKIGNNVNGKKLIAGNLVAIYYLKTDKNAGQVGGGSLDGNQLFFYNTESYNTIMGDARSNTASMLTLEQINSIRFSNTNTSTRFGEIESVDQIRKNATNTFKRQGRLVTKLDFKSYIDNHFNNILKDVVVVDNTEFLNGHYRYYHSMGLKSPSNDSRVLQNQLAFSDSCNFNNLYIYCVPTGLLTDKFSFNTSFLGIGLKDYIRNIISPLKLTSIELIFQDPVYYALGIGTATQGEMFNKQLTSNIIQESQLILIKTNSNEVSLSELKNKVITKFVKYFSFANTNLGQLINIDLLTKEIYEIEGLTGMYTRRGDTITPGLNLVGFNPVYSEESEDISIISQNVKLPYYKIPYLFNVDTIKDQIIVTNQIPVI